MKLRLVVLIAVLALVFSVAGCSKQDDAPITTGGGVPEGHPTTGGEGQGPVVAPVSEIVVPDDVKKDWGSTILAIEDKDKGEIKDVTVTLNSDYTIPDSSIKIAVGDFLPDFRMTGTTITSNTNEPNNPAIQVIITEADAEIFSGWLYARFPAIHPFQHEKYGVTLKAGVKN